MVEVEVRHHHCVEEWQHPQVEVGRVSAQCPELEAQDRIGEDPRAVHVDEHSRVAYVGEDELTVFGTG